MKTILITGASSGFGYVTTLLLTRAGYTVYAGVRNLQKAESVELQTIATKEQLALHVIQLDITKQSDISQLSSIASSIDVLINNAGFGFLGPVELFTLEEIKEQFDVNFFGTIRMIKTITPSMRKRTQGMIINISSISGLLSLPLYGVYASSKFALEAYSEALYYELKPFHVHVTLIEPGSFLTGFITNSKFPQLQSEKDSPYYNLTQQFFSKYRKFDTLKSRITASKTFHPNKVASRILQLIKQDNPPLRNVVGIDAQTLLLSRYLPQAVKTFLLRRAYAW